MAFFLSTKTHKNYIEIFLELKKIYIYEKHLEVKMDM